MDGQKIEDRQVKPTDDGDAFASCRILLADDVAIGREIIQALLKELRVACDAVENGEQAVRLARSTAYDLILMDVQMPVMDGIAATRAIRTLSNCGRPPIVAITANASMADHRECLNAGMDDFLLKPVRKATLRAILEKWLRPQSTPAR